MTTLASSAPHNRYERRFDGLVSRRLAPIARDEVDLLPVTARVASVPTDHDFMALHTAYRRFGGLARAHELSRSWAADGAAFAGRIEHLIDEGRVFAFHWHDSLWLPRFQLDREAHDTVPALEPVLAELDNSLDGWELAAWFVEANAWLDGLAPVEQLADALPTVLDAARADRFVRCG